jgi:hypothetical protein
MRKTRARDHYNISPQIQIPRSLIANVGRFILGRMCLALVTLSAVRKEIYLSQSWQDLKHEVHRNTNSPSRALCTSIQIHKGPGPVLGIRYELLPPHKFDPLAPSSFTSVCWVKECVTVLNFPWQFTLGLPRHPALSVSISYAFPGT